MGGDIIWVNFNNSPPTWTTAKIGIIPLRKAAFQWGRSEADIIHPVHM
jgi:hypothetical protein